MHPKYNRLLLWIMLASLVLNVLLIWMTWPYLKTNVLYWAASSKDPEMAPIKIRAAVAKRASISKKIPVSGTIKAIDVVPIMSEIQGKITKINFKQGDLVQKGEVLIQLDDRHALAELKDAQAREKHTKASYERQKILMAKNYGSPAALEKAEAELAMANAAVEKAQVQLLHTQILAPFEGEIGLHNVSVGTHVALNQEITRLVSSNPLEIEFHIPEADIGKIFQDQEVEVFVEGYDTLPFIAKITAIEPYSDPIAHTVKVRAQMENLDNKVKDGAFARVIVPLSQEKESVVVPQEAVIQEGDQDFVFVVINDRAKKVAIMVGAREHGQVQVGQEIKEGDLVAIDPVEMLMDGLPVSIDPSE